ncbi:MAG: hypothetical protein OXT67_09685, partial [Zetaproteobacteria bacterium]|nr:hypothetical protein [Zetaproteobacteria bacterium]
MPTRKDKTWQVIHSWQHQESGRKVFEAKSNQIAQTCKSGSFIKFPIVLYASQVIYQNEQLILSYGNPGLTSANFVASAPTLDCNLIQANTTLRWKVYGYSDYFNRIPWYPRVVDSYPHTKLFGEKLYVAGFFVLFFLALAMASVMYKTEHHYKVLGTVLCATSCGLYLFFNSLPAYTGPYLSHLHLSPELAHKLSDTFISLGATGLFLFLFQEGVLLRKVFLFHCISSLIGLAIVTLSSDGDVIQFGTTFQFIPILVSFMNISITCFFYSKQSKKKSDWIFFGVSTLFIV